MKNIFRLRRAAVLLCVLLACVGASAAHAAPRERCFSETNQCVSGAILAYWERNGGLPVFGYPISDLRTENIEGSWTGPVQWFERDRLEDHGEQGVMAGRLGALFLDLEGRPWQRGEPRLLGTSCQWFEQTGHEVCGEMLDYWNNYGGLMRFGYPLTDLIPEQIEGNTYQVQYFERRRMEFHPEHAGTPYAVQLGLLGRDLLAGTQSDSLAIGALYVTPERLADSQGNPTARAVYSYETVTLTVEGVQNAARVVFFADPAGQLGRDIGRTTRTMSGRAVLRWTVPPDTGTFTLYAQASDTNGQFVTSQAVPLVVLLAGQVPPSN